MKKAVLLTAIFLSVGAAHAAPSPVEDIAGGSSNDRLARLERIVKARQQASLETQQRLEQLQREVQDLRGLNEQQAYQIEQMLQRQRQLYDEISKLQAQPATSAVSTSTEAATNTNDVATSTTLSETDSYQRAVNLVLKSRTYDEAIPAFQEFIKTYPDSSYAANANYWLGQLLFNKGQLKEAKSAFQTVINKHSDSSKSPNSMMKLGKIAEQQNDKALAARYYRRVLNEYPKSSDAILAKKSLASLK
ncbi:tol-pal system protein YbgF [Shewanella sp. 202IG2-18]|uniref:tol-pal system protein YbgF n=1 Tax=Parashewanella hymeniacidonis TaxID=2807618 RepID=UPI001961D6CF|nr:tol-pal system protein YbgF [Parashewanella hymeniacidonis]MBM7072535.1 tol-pal system protein YbgF [Parashewanella hymeniacidonis]